MGRGCAAGRIAPRFSDDAEEFHHPAGPKELKLYALHMKRKVARDKWMTAMLCFSLCNNGRHPYDQEAICKMVPFVWTEETVWNTAITYYIKKFLSRSQNRHKFSLKYN